MTNPSVITLTRALTCGATIAGQTGNSGGDQRSSIGGLIVEYGVDATPSGPFARVRFADGSVSVPSELSHIKLLRDHDLRQPIGVMTGLEPVENGLDGAFRLGRHPAGVEAAGLVEDQILDGLSVGVVPVEYHEEEGTTVVTRAELYEVSLVTIPAFSSARAAVAASQNRKEDPVNAPVPTPEPTAPPAPVPAPATGPDEVMAALAAIQAQLGQVSPAPAAPAPLPEGALPPVTYDVRAANGAHMTYDGRILATERPGRYPAARGRDGRAYTAGDYFVAFAKGQREGDWADERAIRAALADQTTTEVPGLLPYQIVGALLGTGAGRRPVWDSFSARDMPMVGSKFARPKVTQHVKVDPQATEKSEVASQPYKVVLEDVAKSTFAGALDVSQQAIDWTSPALINQLVADFVRVYVNRTEAYACTTLAAGATGTAYTWDGSAATLPAALAAAASEVYLSLGVDDDAMPNTAWIATDVWQRLAALTGKDDRPIFPMFGLTNTDGSRDLSRPDRGPDIGGFNWIVGKHLTAGTFIIGDNTLVESYENGRRFLQAVVPSVLGLDIAYMGYVATYLPYPTALVPIKVTPPSGSGTAAASK